MSKSSEWRVDLSKDLGGQVDAVLYECDAEGKWSLVDHATFGPFDTATDVMLWEVRHWAPRAQLPLR